MGRSVVVRTVTTGLKFEFAVSIAVRNGFNVQVRSILTVGSVVTVSCLVPSYFSCKHLEMKSKFVSLQLVVKAGTRYRIGTKTLDLERRYKQTVPVNPRRMLIRYICCF